MVDKKTRGMGLGKKLISFLLNIAENKKCYKTILNCKKEYITFYEKCGLKHNGVEMVKYIK